ncbi:MAG: PilZ domain-containing protein [Armatimonadota bacterium]
MKDFGGREVSVTSGQHSVPRTGKLKFVQSPVVCVEFSDPIEWAPGQQVVCQVADAGDEVQISATVLAQEERDISFWVTDHSLVSDFHQEDSFKPEMLYVTLNHDGHDVKSATVDVSRRALRVKATERLNVGLHLTCTIHMGMLPMVLNCQVVRCSQPVGASQVDTTLQIVESPRLMQARWEHFVEELARAA